VTTAINTEPWAVFIEAINWDRDDWHDHYQDAMGDTFASSVIWASDDNCLLCTSDLDRLLEQHGVTHAAYAQEWAQASLHGWQVLPLQHAAQALCWLGY